MRIKILMLAFCFTASIVLAALVDSQPQGFAAGQPPPKKDKGFKDKGFKDKGKDKGKKKGKGGAGFLNDDDMVEHIMAFDKNKTGKVAVDDLPERMQHLIARGDTNNDGALDENEIRALAAKMAVNNPIDTFGKKGGKGKGPPDGKKGFGPDGKKKGFGPPDGKKKDFGPDDNSGNGDAVFIESRPDKRR